MTQNSGKCYTYYYSFIIATGYKSEPTTGRDTHGTVWEGPNMKLCQPQWYVTLWHINMWQYTDCCQLGCSSELRCPEFLLGFPCVSTTDWIIACRAQSPDPLPSPWGQADVRWLKGPPSSHVVGPSYVTSPHLCHFFSVNYLGIHHESPY